jgi:hypothetical protein
MKWFPSFGFQRRKRELQDEIDAHLQMAIADRVARGETAETARQAAAREFGNIPLVQDVTRDMWGQAYGRDNVGDIARDGKPAAHQKLGEDCRQKVKQIEGAGHSGPGTRRDTPNPSLHFTPPEGP